MKREHGEVYPLGTDTVAAPATVSGECPSNATGAMCREGELDTLTREARRPAIASKINRTGMYREISMTILISVNQSNSVRLLHHIMSPPKGGATHRHVKRDWLGI